jgi:DNA-binding winged helix-turn-helix (wHTH) protein
MFHRENSEAEVHVQLDRLYWRLFRVMASSSTRDEIPNLRPQEQQLLRFMDERNRMNNYTPVVCSYEELVAAIWHGREIEDGKADLTHLVMEVRRKVEPNPEQPLILRNVRGRGYLLKSTEWAGVHEASPFVCGRPITTPRYFFGRQRELKHIFGLWKRLPLQSIALIGPRRSGKTSLLYYLRQIFSTPPELLRPDQCVDWLPNADQYQIVLVDFRDARLLQQGRLLHYLLASLRLPAAVEPSIEQFMDIASTHLTRPALLLMDDIGKALRAPDLKPALWDSLRSLSCNYTQGRLAFVLSCEAVPGQLNSSATMSADASPFFNMFGHPLWLGPLEECAARELIASSPIPFEEDDAEWILAESGRWPSLLQHFCYLRLEALEEQRSGDEWKEAGRRAIAPYRNLIEPE